MRSVQGSVALLMFVMLSACVSQRPALVVDRSGRSAPMPQLPTGAPPQRDAKDGVYVVQRGDTLFGVATAFGVSQRDLARWNNLADGAALRPGQTLRVVEPTDVATASPITGTTEAEVRPLPLPGSSGATVAPTPLPPVAPAVPAAPTTTGPTAPAPPVADATRPPTSAIPWLWPTAGKVVETFDDPRNKGIDIAGVEGAPVQAAADGEVVYVGSAVRGYGNLVIVRHSDDFITAYAHNRKILVAEKQAVKRGQAIAELGRSDADRPKLHFEIRHQGKPVDPLKHLPAR